MLSILYSSLAMKTGLTNPFQGTGGTPPYAYLVLPGGAGGMINGSGLYTSPSSLSSGPNGKPIQVDTIQVSDSLGAIAQVKVLIANPLELVCDIIQQGLSLDDDQVYLYNEKFTIPNDQRLYIAVGISSSKPFANKNAFDGTNSLQSLNVQTTLTLDILSRGLDALNRKEEILMALNSNYAETQQELNSFNIARISSNFINLTEEEGAAMLFRFQISLNIQYAIVKSTVVPYYDTFLPVTEIVEP